MELEEKQIKRLKQLLTLLEPDQLTREEFVKSFEQVIKIVQTIKNGNEKEFELIHENLKLMSEKMKEDSSSDMAGKKKEMMDYCHAEMEKMYKNHEKMMGMMDKKMAEMKDGKDADEEVITEKVLAQIKIPEIEEIEKELPKLGKEIRDSLELLQNEERLDVSAIKGLTEKLEELKQMKTGGKVFGASVIHKFIDDETPTGTINGVNKDFVLSKSPLGLKVYRGGARQRITEDYTLSNKTITFIVAPVAGEIILCDYRHY